MKGAADHDDSGLAALMRSEYNLSPQDTDEMTDAEFYGLAQNLERLEERRGVPPGEDDGPDDGHQTQGHLRKGTEKMKLPTFTREEIARASRNAADIARAAETLTELQRLGVDVTPDAGLTARIADALRLPESAVSLANLHQILKERNPYKPKVSEMLREGFDRGPKIADFSPPRVEATQVTEALLNHLDSYQRRCAG